MAYIPLSRRIVVRQSTQPGATPTAAELNFGEFGVNVADGQIYVKYDPGTGAIVSSPVILYTPVNRAGDTMEGTLVLNADPVNVLDAVTKQYVDNANVAQDTIINGKVAKAGDTMTGFLTLNADPVNVLHATTKQYVDTNVATATTTATNANNNANTRVLRAGDTMTGLLTLSGAPTVGLHAATKNYVDSANIAQDTVINERVAKAGDTMTGLLTLSGAPTVGLHAATKTYVDSSISSATTQSALAASLDAVYVNVSGDTMSGALVLSGDPISAMHAATKQYVDHLAAGVNVHASVKATTTANLGALSGLLTVDGYTLQAGDRVLVKNQSTPSQNGVYIAASGSWTRAGDFDGTPSNEVSTGDLMFVENGTQNANTSWILITPNPIVVGTTAMTFTLFARGADYIAGAGLTLTGNTFDVGTAAASRIVVNANNIDLATTGVGSGTYNNVTVDVYGRVTAGSNIGYITGNQTITLSGDVSGSGATGITTTLANVGSAVTNQFVRITTDAKGRVTATSAVISGDITTTLGYTPVNRAGDTMTGALTIGAPGDGNPTLTAFTAAGSATARLVGRPSDGYAGIALRTSDNSANSLRFESIPGVIHAITGSGATTPLVIRTNDIDRVTVGAGGGVIIAQPTTTTNALVVNGAGGTIAQHIYFPASSTGLTISRLADTDNTDQALTLATATHAAHLAIRAAAGEWNPGTQNGDLVIISRGTAVDTGTLLLGSWSNVGRFLRMNAAGNWIFGHASGNAPSVNVLHGGGNSFGVALQLETTAGTDNPRMVFRHHNAGAPKNWGIGSNGTGWGIFEDTNAASGFGTARVTVAAGGNTTINGPATGNTLTLGQVSGGESILMSTSGFDCRVRMQSATSGDVILGMTTFGASDWSIGNRRSNGHFVFSNASSSLDTARLTLDTAGNLTASGNVTAFSDIRLKTDLVKIDGALDKVSSLTGYTYTRTDSGERQTGLSAQDVQAVLPEAVMTANDELGTLSVAYGNMMGLMVEAIKELRAEVTALRGEVKVLKGE